MVEQIEEAWKVVVEEDWARKRLLAVGLIADKMDTETFGAFRAQVTASHPDDFLVMVVDGASFHVSKELRILKNIRFHRLPAYSPELNPVEHLWDEIREKSFPNCVFSEMKAALAQLEKDLPILA
jgi:hypothetical protein